MSVHDDNKNLIPHMLKDLETAVEHVNNSPLAQQSAELVMALRTLHSIAENLVARVGALETELERVRASVPTQGQMVAAAQGSSF